MTGLISLPGVSLSGLIWATPVVSWARSPVTGPMGLQVRVQTSAEEVPCALLELSRGS